ncbi:hypothetical protein [Janthinobacterium psychrotolerans]|uniref:Uncharacterized protein n=1 Tax=Janthinobacterium psychrotolerans TaxID=1747903 RepID=A0A1A7C7F3_9BURK|nr:hypothetical protein [Janthinobacterium psychrotolerans]OBV41647.1 hypothetical protein ASR47_10407 [Janthinobacterium psychrotolerans]
MAKKEAGKEPAWASVVEFKQDFSAMKSLLEEMIAAPENFRPKVLKDHLEPLWPFIEKALAAGVPVGVIAQRFRDSEQLDVSDAGLRKYVKEKQDAGASASSKAGNAAAKALAATASGKPKP